MRALVVLVALSAIFAAPVSAQEPPARERATKPAPAAKPEPPRRQTLDDLFERLKAAKDETEAKGVEGLIERRWARSGSDTADLLMSRAGEALNGKDFPLAIELMDRVLALEPGWAEAWYRRATAFHLMDDPVRSLADLEQALAREPRHFNAWAGLGHIQMASENKKQALVAYRKALGLHPFLDKMKEAVDRLVPDVEGRDI